MGGPNGLGTTAEERPWLDTLIWLLLIGLFLVALFVCGQPHAGPA
jgi:hypothetical protein